MREMRSKYKTMIGKPEGKKRPLEIEMGMSRDSIEINLEKQGKGVDWIHMAQANFREQNNEFSGSITCGKFLDWQSFTNRMSYPNVNHSCFVFGGGGGPG
jgi:hypothetical protein